MYAASRSLFKCLPLASTLTMLVGIPACTALVQRNMQPAQVVLDEHPSWIVIGTTAGEELVLRTPHLQGDTLVVGSLVESIGDYPDPPDLIGIPVTEIAWVGTREPDRIAKAKALANVVAFAGVLVVPLVVLVIVGYE